MMMMMLNDSHHLPVDCVEGSTRRRTDGRARDRRYRRTTTIFPRVPSWERRRCAPSDRRRPRRPPRLSRGTARRRWSARLPLRRWHSSLTDDRCRGRHTSAPRTHRPAPHATRTRPRRLRRRGRAKRCCACSMSVSGWLIHAISVLMTETLQTIASTDSKSSLRK